MARVDRILAAIIAVIACVVLFDTRSYPPSMVPGAPGPALFPRVLAVALLLMAGLLVAGSYRTRSTAVPRPGVRGLYKPSVLLVLLVAFLTLIETDFFVLLPILFGSVMALMGERHVPALVGGPIAFTVFVYVVFQKVFGVAFPTVIF